MSTTTNDNDESTEDASDQKKKKEQSSSISTRRLNSFGIPDLEVLIGPKQRIYRYHALFLASYSMYVDTILSSPMTSAAAAATNSDDERPLRRIVFEDIEEDTWEIMISYLEPSSRFDPVKLADLERILPFYDKYQFVDGISLCDSAISYNLQTKHYTPLDGYETFRPERFVPIAVLAYHLNLPLSKKHAIAWASEVLKTMTPNSEDTITKLLPLVENDDTVLISLVKTIRGRHYTDMTMDEMRVLTQSESFARDVLLKTKQIEDLEQVLRDLHVKDICIRNHPRIEGSYERNRCRQWADEGLRHRGPMQFTYSKTILSHYAPRPTEIIKIDAMDAFGLKWEISAIPIDDDDDDAQDDQQERPRPERLVLFRWDCGYSSLLPPKHGWQSVVLDGGGGGGESQAINISYSIN